MEKKHLNKTGTYKSLLFFFNIVVPSFAKMPMVFHLDILWKLYDS